MDNEKELKNILIKEIVFSILKLIGLVIGYNMILKHIIDDPGEALIIMMIITGLIKSPVTFDWIIYACGFNGVSFVCLLIEIFGIILSGIIILPWIVLKNIYIIFKNGIILYMNRTENEKGEGSYGYINEQVKRK